MQRIEAGEGRVRRSQAVVRTLFDPRLVAALAAGLAGFAIVTGVETSWIQSPKVVANGLAETVVAEQEAIDLWENTPRTLATARSVQPRLAAIERTAANRFYRPDPRHMVVGIYGRIDPDLQQLDLDGQLDRAKQDPRGFLRQLDNVEETERRSRIAPLVVRASRRGDAQIVASRLRDTSHPLANKLAAEFDRSPSNTVNAPNVIRASY